MAAVNVGYVSRKLVEVEEQTCLELYRHVRPLFFDVHM